MDSTQGSSPYSILKRFARPRVAAEVCDLCAQEIAPEHRHLLERSTRQILCACDACGTLFSAQADTPYRLVPRRTRFLPNFHMSDAQWDDLLIPVGMAFFFYSSAQLRTMAFYPSPAGPTESLLTLEAWEEVAHDNPVLAEMQPDVEALLVNRLKGARDYYLAPIDKCYELVGLIRANWRGLSGGPEVWKEIDNFFTRLKAQAGVKEPEARDLGPASSPDPQPLDQPHA
jgi:hypothetical protein